MNIVQIKNSLDIPAGLRWLADTIEKGEHGEVKNVAWALDSDTIFANGILGAGDQEKIAYFLHGLAQKEILEDALE